MGSCCLKLCFYLWEIAWQVAGKNARKIRVFCCYLDLKIINSKSCSRKTSYVVFIIDRGHVRNILAATLTLEVNPRRQKES